MAHELLDLTLPKSEEIRVRKRFRPVVKKFKNQTKFFDEELEALIIIHYKLTKNRPMDRKYFTVLMNRLFGFYNETLKENIFSTFDRFNNHVITPESWLLGMSIFLRGDLEEKIKFCFKVYDQMGTGFIRRDWIFQLLKNNIRQTSDEDSEEVVRDLVDLLLKKMDQDADGKLSFADYRSSVRQNPDLLEAFGPCFPDRPAVYEFMNTFTQKVTTMHCRQVNKVMSEKELPFNSQDLMITPSFYSNASKHTMTWGRS